MLNTQDIETIQACISNYISVAENQRNSLTVGDKNGSPLVDFYNTKINNCYEVLHKINTEPLEIETNKNLFSNDDLLKVSEVLQKLLTLK